MKSGEFMALASLSDVKLQLDIPTSNTAQDARLTLYINAATQAIQTYCDRVFDVTARTEYHDGDLSNAIMSHQWPIISVTELWVDPTRSFTDTTYQLAPTDYLIQGESRITFTNLLTPRVSGSIKLVYSSGYSTVPPDLNLACIWLVEWFQHHRNRGDMGRTNVSKGDESIGILAEAPKMILQLLGPYRSNRASNEFNMMRRV